MESIGRAAERRAVLENQIAALKAPDRSAWKSIQGAGHDFDIAKLRVEALALRLEILAEGDLTANVIAGDPAGESRLLAGPNSDCPRERPYNGFVPRLRDAAILRTFRRRSAVAG